MPDENNNTNKRLTTVETIDRHFATKADLIEAIARSRQETHDDMTALRKDLNSEMTASRKEISDARFDIIKWVVTMSFASPALLVAIFALAKKLALV